MAEYIDRAEVLELKQDYGEGQYSMMLIDPVLVKKLSTADVIERAQYNRVLELIAYLCEEHDKRVTEYNNLRSKVDKAIEEIQNANVCECHCITCIRTEDVLEILKRNIGE